MASVKKARSVSHPFEVMREVYALQFTEQRLRGIAVGLGLAENEGIPSTCSALRTVLRDSIGAEANRLADIADRLAGLLGRDRASLKPKDGARWRLPTIRVRTTSTICAPSAWPR